MSRVLFALLAVFCAAPGWAQPQDASPEEEPPPVAPSRSDVIKVTPQAMILELQWSDAEDALRGAVTPPELREGEPLRVTVRIGSYYGGRFEGPVTLTLRGEGEEAGQSVTVEPDEGSWSTTFVARNDGVHTLDVSFRTTRYKVLHATLNIRESRLPQWLAWSLLALLVLLALGLGVYRTLRKSPTPSEPPLTT